MIIQEPTEVTLKLMSDEIEEIIGELGRVPRDVYEFLNYNKIVIKLNKSLESVSVKEKKR